MLGLIGSNYAGNRNDNLANVNSLSIQQGVPFTEPFAAYKAPKSWLWLFHQDVLTFAMLSSHTPFAAHLMRFSIWLTLIYSSDGNQWIKWQIHYVPESGRFMRWQQAADASRANAKNWFSPAESFLYYQFHREHWWSRAVVRNRLIFRPLILCNIWICVLVIMAKAIKWHHFEY